MERFENSREHLRTPTPAWAGFGLSKTSPLVMDTNKMANQWTRPAETTMFDKISTTSLMDTIASADRNSLSHFKDIHSLLTHIKLEHYISELIISTISIKSNLFICNGFFFLLCRQFGCSRH